MPYLNELCARITMADLCAGQRLLEAIELAQRVLPNTDETIQLEFVVMVLAKKLVEFSLTTRRVIADCETRLAAAKQEADTMHELERKELLDKLTRVVGTSVPDTVQTEPLPKLHALARLAAAGLITFRHGGVKRQMPSDPMLAIRNAEDILLTESDFYRYS